MKPFFLALFPFFLAAAPSPYAKLLTDLASPNFQTRDAAQKQLDAFSYDLRPAVESLFAQATDPEVKARLRSRLDAFEEQFATNPPPISLDLKNAPIPDLEEALAKATGFEYVPLQSAIPINLDETFTLHAVNQPFWTVFAELSRQHPLLILPSASGWHLRTGLAPNQPVQSFGGFVTDFQTVGTFAFWQTGVERRTMSGRPSILVHYSIAVDPRIRIMRTSVPVWKEIIDDQGNHLSDSHTPRTGTMGSGSLPHYTTLDIPPNLGTKIVSMKGDMKVVAAWHDQSKVVESPEKHLNEKIELGTATATLTQFDVTEDPNDPRGDYRALKFNVKVDWIPGSVQVPVHIQVFAGTKIAGDTACFSDTLTAQSGGASGGTNPGAFTVKLTFPTRTKELLLPLEFKNIQLP